MGQAPGLAWEVIRFVCVMHGLHLELINVKVVRPLLVDVVRAYTRS